MNEINVDGIAKILADFKNERHSKNPCIVLGDAPQMDVLFKNFSDAAKKDIKGEEAPDGFTVIDYTRFEKDDKPRRVTISRDDVLMMIDTADSRGFKLFGKHCEKPGQYGILYTRKGVVVVNRFGDEPGREGGFISWKGYQFCLHLLVDQQCGYADDLYGYKCPGEFVYMWYQSGINRNELYRNVSEKIKELLGCNNDWKKVVKNW